MCPFCRLVEGDEDEHRKQHDVVRRDELATAFVSPRWWPRNHGHVMVVPNAHFENLYDLPSHYGHAVHDLAREVAIAIRRTYGCDGTSLRQHNEPAGKKTDGTITCTSLPRYGTSAMTSTLPGRSSTSLRLGSACRTRTSCGSASSRRQQAEPRQPRTPRHVHYVTVGSRCVSRVP